MGLSGVSDHARERAKERLGSDLSEEQWRGLLEGLRAEAYPRQLDASGGSSTYFVPLRYEDGSEGELGVVYSRTNDTIVTVLPPR